MKRDFMEASRSDKGGAGVGSSHSPRAASGREGSESLDSTLSSSSGTVC